MRKFAGLCLIVALLLAACGGGNNATGNSGGGGGGGGTDMSTPAGTMNAIQAAFAANDADALLKCYTDEYVKKDGEKMKKELKEMADEGGSFSLSFTDADITVDGDKATVKAKLKIKMKGGKEEEESETFRLVKKDGVWKCEG